MQAWRHACTRNQTITTRQPPHLKALQTSTLISSDCYKLWKQGQWLSNKKIMGALKEINIDAKMQSLGEQVRN